MSENKLYSVKGRIFDIQRFSVHDGPGVRTIIFLKGCPLRCRWCCNPESQEWNIQEMTLGGQTKTVGRDVTVGEIMDEIIGDRPYYRRSGGGITLSGGESLGQPEFAVALLKSAKNAGITTAIETTGYASREVVASYLPYLDTVLMDIKHMDGEKHKEFTGRDNALILDNARFIAESGAHLVIRTPVVPTFNDTIEEIGDIARFAASLPGVKEHHLLPYHRIGTDKYAGLGRKYTLPDIMPPSDEKMQELLSVVNGIGLKGQIGG
ncbi:MAG: glycyl-radical enzyme activating protein [Clostridia bacterium]|nr:glycyl-radical enzyme activating protein [Clostridia bacterium]